MSGQGGRWSVPPLRVDPGPLVPELHAASERAVRWILARQRRDGAIGDPVEGFNFARAPWALALAGRSDEALAVLAWIRRELLTSEGHLEGSARARWTDWAYLDSNVIVGAQMLGQHDLGLGLVPSLLRWQDPISGAFANHRSEVDGAPSDDMDIPYACGPGFALLMAGRLSEAQRIGRFLATILEVQPEFPDRLYCFWSRARQRPIFADDPEFLERHVVDNTADRMQRWTVGGIAAAFLCRLHLADSDPEWLALAQRYQAFSMAATDAQFGYPSACKSSWGAALLLEMTREERYRAWLGRMARWYLDAQGADGCWVPFVDRTEGDRIQITLEFIVHLRTITGALTNPGFGLPLAVSASSD